MPFYCHALPCCTASSKRFMSTGPGDSRMLSYRSLSFADTAASCDVNTIHAARRSLRDYKHTTVMSPYINASKIAPARKVEEGSVAQVSVHQYSTHATKRVRGQRRNMLREAMQFTKTQCRTRLKTTACRFIHNWRVMFRMRTKTSVAAVRTYCQPVCTSVRTAGAWRIPAARLTWPISHFQ